MQLCPCIRLRLWRQHGRDWQKQWASLTTASPTAPTTAATATRGPASIGSRRGIGSTTLSGLSPSTGPAAVEPGDESYSTERRYHLGNKGSGGRYDDLWGAAADAVAADAVQGGALLGRTALEPLARHGTRPKARAPAKKPMLVKRWKRTTGDAVRKATSIKPATPKQRPRAFLGQIGHLRRSCPPEDFARANMTFWIWKQSLALTWEMLETGKLPQTGTESHLLRWLLESGQDSTGPEHMSSASGTSGTTSTRIESMRTAWKTLPDTRRRNAWPALIISVLRSRPADAPAVFQATFDASLVPSYLAEDTLHYLIRQHVAPPPSVSGPPPTTADELFRLLRVVQENSPDGYLRLQQATIYFYIRSMSTTEGISQLYNALVAHKNPLHENTRLQIAGRLAVDPAYKMQAIYVLQAMLESTGLDINTPKGAALCTNILSVRRSGGPEGTAAASLTTVPKRPSPSEATAVATPAEMFELLLQCGLEPNLITYTTILRDLCLARELDAAQQVLQLMIEKNKIEPDAYVYSTMLNGAKLCGDFPMLRQVAVSAAAQGIRHPFVWNDFLQSLYATAFSEARRNPATAKRPRVVPAFPLMLQAYSRLFALGPLYTILPTIGGHGVSAGQSTTDDQGHSSLVDAELPLLPSTAMQHWNFSAQMAPTVHELPLLPPSDRMQPTGSTLVTMVLGYIQGLSNPYDVIAFYSHFRRLLQEGNAVAVAIVREQGTVVHDAVVMALCDFESMLRVALDVLGDMLRDAAQAMPDGAAEADTTASAFPHPTPSAYTWSILLNGFMFHRQSLQGERILNMMRERGIAPNQVTWNTLVAGYARQQNARKTAGALQRLERAGFEPNEFTLRAFSYLHNKGSALQYLESRGRTAAVAKAKEAEAAAAATDTERRTGVAASQIHTTIRSPMETRHGRLPYSPVAGGAAPAFAAADINDLASSSSTSELRELADEVEQISRMMDDEQRGTVAAEGAATATPGHL